MTALLSKTTAAAVLATAFVAPAFGQGALSNGELTADVPAATADAVTMGLSTSAGSAAAAPSGDEAAIRTTIRSYVEAFNRGDAEALSLHWAERGQFVGPTGETFTGHDELLGAFASYFDESPGAKIELLGTTVELISPNVATESGAARVVTPGSEPVETEYSAVHVRADKGWKIDSLRERDAAPPAPSHYDRLSELEWMVGSWVAEGDDSSVTVEVTCRWTTNQNFLVRTYRVTGGSGVGFEGSQVIGWDTHAGSIRSWVFDSDGGFGIGRWSGGDGLWTVQTLNVLPDGRRGSSTNTYELVDADTVRFGSIGRQVDGELLPSIDPVTVVRSMSP